MKQVLLAMGALILVMFGFAWMNGKNLVKPIITEVGEQQLYISGGPAVVGEEKELVLMAKSSQEKINGFDVEVQFDKQMVEIKELMINSEIFNKSQVTKVDDNIGRMVTKGESGKKIGELESGEVWLVRMKVVGRKKGSMMFLSGKRPMVNIWKNGIMEDGNFTFNGYKLSVL